MNIKYTTASWIKAVQDKWHFNYDYSKVVYRGAKEKVCIICHEKDENGNEHGEFWQEANAHKYHGHKCPKCANNQKKDTAKFIYDAKKVHGNKYDYSKVNYQGNKNHVEIICPVHGSFFQEASGHLRGRGCPKCNVGYIQLSQKQWIEKAKKIHGDRYDYSKVNYINCDTPIIIICKEHGEFYQLPRSHFQGRGCPKCHLKAQSILFNKLKIIFNEEDFIWEYNDQWLGKQRIDIYMSKYKIGIEYQGEQHFHPIDIFKGEEGFKVLQIRDRLKLEKCIENNVKLFYINYNYTEEDFNNLVSNIKEIIKNYQE